MDKFGLAIHSAELLRCTESGQWCAVASIYIQPNMHTDINTYFHNPHGVLWCFAIGRGSGLNIFEIQATQICFVCDRLARVGEFGPEVEITGNKCSPISGHRGSSSTEVFKFLDEQYSFAFSVRLLQACSLISGVYA